MFCRYFFLFTLIAILVTSCISAVCNRYYGFKDDFLYYSSKYKCKNVNLSTLKIRDLIQNETNYDSIGEIVIENATGKKMSATLFDSFFTHRIPRLTITNSDLTEIKMSDLKNMLFSKLTFTNNKITELNNDSFNNTWIGGASINLSSNKIVKVDENAFKIIQNLEYINLSNNYIEEIPYNVFNLVSGSSARYSITIDLSFNKLVYLNLSLPTCGKGINFSLNNNILTRVNLASEKTLFFNELELSHNFINSIKLPTLVKCNKLMLSHNKFDAINQHTLFNINASILNLSSNNIKTIDNNVFSEFQELKEIYLNTNKLENFPIDAFKFFKSTKIIDLNHNLLKNISFNLAKNTNFKDLLDLNLSNNLIETIEIGSFSSMKSLTSLTLAGNKLSKLKSGTFNGLLNLDTLNVAYNVLHILEDHIFSDLEKLTSLDISFNKFLNLNLENFIAHSSQLRLISMDENKWQWHCNYLANFIKHHPKITIQGNHYKETNIKGIPCNMKSIHTRDKNMNAKNETVDLNSENIVYKSTETNVLYSVLLCLILIVLLVQMVIKLVTFKCRNTLDRRSSQQIELI